MKEFTLLNELAKESKTNPETIKTYIEKGLITAFIEGEGAGRFRRFKTKDALRQIEEIKELKRNGSSLELIKKSFTPCKDKDCGHSQFDHELFHKVPPSEDITKDKCSICNCKEFK